MRTLSGTKWSELSHPTNKGWEVTHHMYSDTFNLYHNGRLMAEELASYNSQGDMYIFWVEQNFLHISCYAKRESSHSAFIELAEKLSGQKIETLLRR